MILFLLESHRCILGLRSFDILCNWNLANSPWFRIPTGKDFRLTISVIRDNPVSCAQRPPNARGIGIKQPWSARIGGEKACECLKCSECHAHSKCLSHCLLWTGGDKDNREGSHTGEGLPARALSHCPASPGQNPHVEQASCNLCAVCVMVAGLYVSWLLANALEGLEKMYFREMGWDFLLGNNPLSKFAGFDLFTFQVLEPITIFNISHFNTVLYTPNQIPFSQFSVTLFSLESPWELLDNVLDQIAFPILAVTRELTPRQSIQDK